MKFSADLLSQEQLSDRVTRQRITGEKLECILYTYEAGAEFAMHQHEAEQITIVLEGELIFRFENEKIHLQAGEALFIESNRAHGAYVPSSSVVTKTYNVFTPVRNVLPRG